MKIIHTAIALMLAAGIATAATLPPGADYSVGFSPDGSAQQVIMSGIESAQSSILVAAYSFTSKQISTALLAAQRRGVKVQVVADEKSNGRSYSAVRFLANNGVPVRLNGRYAIMHNKFMVIDGQTVETGSFNFTQAATKSNAENALVLRGAPALAAKYTTEWKRLWDEAEPLSPAY
jgi:phosphatidylserine/phosphatidylglycerophosphate/cardiolipin synthase-like enzyme